MRAREKRSSRIVGIAISIWPSRKPRFGPPPRLVVGAITGIYSVPRLMGIRKLGPHPLCSDHGEFSGLPRPLPLDRPMMMLNQACAALLFGANLVFLVAPPAHAADASAWNGSDRSAVRLIAGTRNENAANLRAGIEMRLASG